MVPTTVRCHAGYRYAQYPVAFRWEGDWVEVEAAERLWREQRVERGTGTRYHYLVRSALGRAHLIYDDRADSWTVALVASGERPASGDDSGASDGRRD